MRRRKPAAGETLSPPYSRFTQQELLARRPQLTPLWLVIAGMVAGSVLLALGGACYSAASSVVEVVQRYDDVCTAGSSEADKEQTLLQAGGDGTTCNVTLRIPKLMTAPVLVYYGLDGFQQNHRRYVRSRSDSQIRGDPASKTITYCEPQEFQGNNRSQLIRPCGLAAWSLFNDTFQIISGNSSLAVDETGISWGQDRRHKYANIPSLFFNTDPALRGGATIPGSMNSDEHLIVWMRPATLPNFRKLWGRIRRDLEADTSLTVTIRNRYNVYRFGGKKHVILTTTSWLGGRSFFLTIAFFAVGGVSLTLSILMAALQAMFKRKLGDLSMLSWTRPAPPAKPIEDALDFELLRL